MLLRNAKLLLILLVLAAALLAAVLGGIDATSPVGLGTHVSLPGGWTWDRGTVDGWSW